MRTIRTSAGLILSTALAACGHGGHHGGGGSGTAGLSTETYVKASNTGFQDRFGTSVALDGDVMVVGAPGEASDAVGVGGDSTNDSLADAGAVFVYEHGPGGWEQTAYLKATDAVPEVSWFGQSVAVSGDTIVVGAPLRDAGGAAYVFVRDGAGWAPQQKLVAPNSGSNDFFGSSVAIDGDTIVVGAQDEDSDATVVDGDGANDDATSAGAAYVFVRTGVAWAIQAYLKASDAAAGARFGGSVAVSGDRAVVGAPGIAAGDSTVGGAYVFARSGTSWSEEQALVPSVAPLDLIFGIGVAIDGDAVVVGTYESMAFVFERSGSSWDETQVLASELTAFVDDAWTSVAISGDRIVVGAVLEDGSATGVDGEEGIDGAPDSGAAYVFDRAGSGWTRAAYLKATDPGTGDSFGTGVATSGGVVAVGAPYEDSSAVGVGASARFDFTQDSGAAYVYR